MGKKEITKKIKKWFLKPMEKNFYRDICFLMIFLQCVSPTTITFFTFLNMGILTPEVNSTFLNDTFTNVSKRIVDTVRGGLQTIYETGQGVGRDSPMIQAIVPHLISYWLVGYWIFAAGLITNVCRYGIAWIYKKVKKK